MGVPSPPLNGPLDELTPFKCIPEWVNMRERLVSISVYLYPPPPPPGMSPTCRAVYVLTVESASVGWSFLCASLHWDRKVENVFFLLSVPLALSTFSSSLYKSWGTKKQNKLTNYKQTSERERTVLEYQHSAFYRITSLATLCNSSGTNTVNLQSHTHITLKYTISLLYGLHTVKKNFNPNLNI